LIDGAVSFDQGFLCDWRCILPGDTRLLCSFSVPCDWSACSLCQTR